MDSLFNKSQPSQIPVENMEKVEHLEQHSTVLLVDTSFQQRIQCLESNLDTSETSETMEAASLKDPSSSLDSTLPFPDNN